MNAIVPRDVALGPPGKPEGDPASPVALRSALWFALFRVIFFRFFRRHMRALRLARWGRPEVAAGAPLVVFANHPSWWDGMAFMLLSVLLFPRRPMFIPMAASALGRYGFMRRLGVFGVESGARGAVRFLQVSAEVLGAPERMLWLNAPGRFCDPRERPVPIVPGLVRLPEIAPGAVFLPLALEYPFWSERAPEMLAAFGAPIPAATLLAMDRQDRAAYLAAALEDTMDRLAEDATARDGTRFELLVSGREGMGGLYQLWRRLGATIRGGQFDPRHDPEARG